MVRPISPGDDDGFAAEFLRQTGVSTALQLTHRSTPVWFGESKLIDSLMAVPWQRETGTNEECVAMRRVGLPTPEWFLEMNLDLHCRGLRIIGNQCSMIGRGRRSAELISAEEKEYGRSHAGPVTMAKDIDSHFKFSDWSWTRVEESRVCGRETAKYVMR
jgi:hypothetical protein